MTNSKAKHEIGPIISRDLIDRFGAVGRDLFVTGATSSHGGNLSVLTKQRIIITRRGSMLGRLGERDIVWTELDRCERDEDCSREIVVHRAIYQATGARAIVHAHPVHTIFRSMLGDSIEPIDSESRYVLGDSIPVVTSEQTVGSTVAAQKLADALTDYPVAVLRSHGPFAVGSTLEEAFYHISALEASCEILDLRDSTGLSTI